MKTEPIARLLSALAFVTLIAAQSVKAQSTAFTYQGRLADTGSPANGFFDITFSVWDAAAGPAQVGGTLTNTAVEVTGGLFTVTLDFGSGVFTGPDRWLEIGVTTNGGGAYTTLAPRTEITATPYALHARTAQDATTAATATTVVGGINDADADPLNELNLSMGLSGTLLELKDAGAVLSVDLAPLVSDNDWDYNVGSGLSGELYRSGDVALGQFNDPDGHGLNVQSYTGGKAAVRGADQNGSSLYAEGMLGVLSPNPFIPLPESLSNAGVVGVKPDNGGSGVAVSGWNYDDNSVNYAGAFVASGTNTGQNIAIYGEALNGADNIAALLKGDVIIENDYLEVKGNANEQAYIGGDGAGNDVQIGSLRSNVVNVATWNPATGSRMHFIASNITAVGSFIGDGSQLTGIGASALGPNSVTSPQLADSIDLGATDVSGRLDVFKTTAGTAAISLIGSSSQISTYGADGLEQIRLWGSGYGELLLRNSISNNAITAKLSANGASGGVLELYNSDGATRTRLEGLNSGASLTLRAADGSVGAFIDGDSSGAGLVQVNDGAGATRVAIDGSGTGSGGEIILDEADGSDAVEIQASAGGHLYLNDGSGQTAVRVSGSTSSGGYQYLYQADGGIGVYLDGDSSGAGRIYAYDSGGSSRVSIDGESIGTGGEISVYDDSGTETIEILGAESTTTGGQIMMRNASGGNTIQLDSDASGVGSGYIRLYKGDGTATVTIEADNGGDGRITTQELAITGGSDLSEQFDIQTAGEVIQPGVLVCIDPLNPGQLMVSAHPYDRTVAGVVSGAGGVKTGMLMGQRGSVADGEHPVALTGRVYCMVDADQGAIQPGDLITTSKVPGHGMKVTNHSRAQGAIVGKAMTGLEEGRGLVLVLVSLQ